MQAVGSGPPLQWRVDSLLVMAVPSKRPFRSELATSSSFWLATLSVKGVSREYEGRGALVLPLHEAGKLGRANGPV